MLLFLKHGFFFYLLLFSFLGWGAWLLPRSAAFLQAVGGLGFCVWLQSLLVLGHLNFPWTFFFPWAGLLLLLFTKGRLHREELARCWKLAILFLPVLGLTLYPVVSVDAMGYHFPVIQRLVSTLGAPLDLHWRYPVFPHGGHVLFSFGYVWGDRWTAVVGVLPVFLSAWGLYELLRNERARFAGVLAFSFLLSHQDSLRFGAAPYVEPVMMPFLLAAAWSFLKPIQLTARTAFFVGCFAGLAASVKHTGLMLGPPLLLLVFLRGGWRFSVYFLLGWLVTGSLWYLRAAGVTGNPLWPFAEKIFGVAPELWSAEDHAYLNVEYARAGIEKTLSGFFLKLPYTLARAGLWFHLLAGALLTLFLLKRRQDWKAAWILVAGYGLAWYLLSGDARYFLPAVPAVIYLAAQGSVFALEKLKQSWQSSIVPGIVLSLTAIHLLIAYGYVFSRMTSWGVPPVSAAEVDAHLHARLPYFSHAKSLGQLSTLTYAHGFAYQKYYAENRYVGDVVGPARLRTLELYWDQPDLLRTHLLSLPGDVRQLMIRKDLVSEQALKGMKKSLGYRVLFEDEGVIIFQFL